MADRFNERRDAETLEKALERYEALLRRGASSDEATEAASRLLTPGAAPLFALAAALRDSAKPMRTPAFADRLEAQIRAGRIVRGAPASRGRPQGVAMLAMAACVAVLSGFLVVASHSLPGDGLYALKRAGESAQLSVTWGSTEAHVHLSLAETRLQEVDGLFARARTQVVGAPGTIAAAAAPRDGMNPRIARLIRDTLREAEVQIQAAATILIAEHSDRRALERLVAVAHRGAALAKGVAATLPSVQKPPVLNTADNLAVVAAQAEAVRQQVPAEPTPTPCVTATPSPSPSATPSPTPSPTQTPAASPAASPEASPSPSPSPTPSANPCVTPSPKPTSPPTPSPTPSPKDDSRGNSSGSSPGPNGQASDESSSDASAPGGQSTS